MANVGYGDTNSSRRVIIHLCGTHDERSTARAEQSAYVNTRALAYGRMCRRVYSPFSSLWVRPGSDCARSVYSASKLPASFHIHTLRNMADSWEDADQSAPGGPPPPPPPPKSSFSFNPNASNFSFSPGAAAFAPPPPPRPTSELLRAADPAPAVASVPPPPAPPPAPIVRAPEPAAVAPPSEASAMDVDEPAGSSGAQVEGARRCN